MNKVTKICLILLIFRTTASAQTISHLDDDGLSYKEILNSEILNKVFKLNVRPTSFTVKIKNPKAFKTKINDGSKPEIEGTGEKTKSGTAVGTILTGSAIINGIYTCGTPVNNTNTADVKILISIPGYYTIQSDPIDGVQFFSTGYIDKAGQRDIKLYSIGTPLVHGNNKTLKIHFGSNNISAAINFIGTDQIIALGNSVVFKSIQGELKEGITLDNSNTMTITSTITTAGYYKFVSDIKNGIFYHATEKLGVGQHEITLNGYGTPFADIPTKPTITGLEASIQQDLKVKAADFDAYVYSISNDITKVEFSNPDNTDKYTIQIMAPTVEEPIDEVDGGISTYEDFIYEKYGKNNLKLTPYGLLMNNKIENQAYIYGGSNYVHIFLDEMGNSLITSVPQGIPEMQYVVHVIYSPENAGKKITYGIKPTKGSFIGGNRIENSKTNAELNSTQEIELREYTLVIKTSTTDIDFDIYRFENGAQKRKLSYTINMTSAYTANISVGLLNTWLKNPTYEILPDPSNSSLKLVKEIEGKNRGYATIFATLYTSPITIIKYYRDKKRMKKGTKLTEINNPVADFQLHSKDYLYMRPVWERIYPTIGVGITDKLFQNLFFGLNWEFARGGSFFAGGHYGKTSVFNAPERFEFEKTNITEDQFNVYKNTEWNVGWTIGASLDFAIISNLFK